MIKFFRKIRQKLLTENKFNKYLLYAIGEIALVVIGILTAISINNANDERKERIELNNYLLKISNDVNRDIEQLEYLKIRHDTVRAIAVQAYNLLIKKDYRKIDVIRKGNIVFREFYFIPNKSGFDAIKTSPYLGKLNNTKLDSLLTDYYAIVDNIENRERGYNQFLEVMEADLMSSIDRLPNLTINIVKSYPGLLNIDTSDVNWEDNMLDEILPFIENNSYKAAIGRVVGDSAYIILYTKSVEAGKNLVDEIIITIKSK